jgi:uncharacterized protein
MSPGIYHGTLRHRRFSPRRHEFTYSLFMVLLDIDDIPSLMRRSSFTSYNRFNWAAFCDRDHIGDPQQPLRDRIAEDALRNGVTLSPGPVYLLTHLRYLGYCFNPISFYFCGDSIVAAEVHSTFGERRTYWLSPQDRDTGSSSTHYTCPKTMHVSPFMKMDLEYDFALTSPEERFTAHIATLEHGACIFDATLSLERQDWTAANLARALVRQPLMTGKVMAAIHWEALRLYFKGVPVQPHPGARP